MWSAQREMQAVIPHRSLAQTLNYSLEGSVALLVVRCLAACLRALPYEPRWLNKCQGSGDLVLQGGQRQLGGPAVKRLSAPVQRQELGLFISAGFLYPGVADMWAWCCLLPACQVALAPLGLFLGSWVKPLPRQCQAQSCPPSLPWRSGAGSAGPGIVAISLILFFLEALCEVPWLPSCLPFRKQGGGGAV